PHPTLPRLEPQPRHHSHQGVDHRHRPGGVENPEPILGLQISIRVISSRMASDHPFGRWPRIPVGEQTAVGCRCSPFMN
ncbi:MAG: hypothetical protein ACK559_07265, partial [bacterium]